jgi:hypothetical protein
VRVSVYRSAFERAADLSWLFVQTVRNPAGGRDHVIRLSEAELDHVALEAAQMRADFDRWGVATPLTPAQATQLALAARVAHEFAESRFGVAHEALYRAGLGPWSVVRSQLESLSAEERAARAITSVADVAGVLQTLAAAAARPSDRAAVAAAFPADPETGLSPAEQWRSRAAARANASAAQTLARSLAARLEGAEGDGVSPRPVAADVVPTPGRQIDLGQVDGYALRLGGEPARLDDNSLAPSGAVPRALAGLAAAAHAAANWTDANRYFATAGETAGRSLGVFDTLMDMGALVAYASSLRARAGKYVLYSTQSAEDVIERLAAHVARLRENHTPPALVARAAAVLSDLESGRASVVSSAAVGDAIDLGDGTFDVSDLVPYFRGEFARVNGGVPPSRMAFLSDHRRLTVPAERRNELAMALDFLFSVGMTVRVGDSVKMASFIGRFA